MHSNLSVHLATSGPGLHPGFDQAKCHSPPTLSDPAAPVQISSPEPFFFASGCCRVGQKQLFQTWRKGCLPCVQSKTDPLSLGHTVQPQSCSLPEVLPGNKGSLRFTARCTSQTPLLSQSYTTWPLPQTQIGANF